MQHDLIWDTAEGMRLGPLWKALVSAGKRPLSDTEFGKDMRKALEDEGWQFIGDSVLLFKRCPSCPEGAKVDSNRLALREALEMTLGDDEDGIQSMLEDFDV